jgi:hypothetical protein
VYEKYTELSLTSRADRPTAIAALERRMLQALDAKGGFGVVDDVGMEGILNMSLLWRRAPGMGLVGLTRIEFPRYTSFEEVPSWSWMSYEGSIEYLEVDFTNTDWKRVTSPWSQVSYRIPGSSLLAKARQLKENSGDPSPLKANIFMDDPYTQDLRLREDDYFVILGRGQKHLMVEADVVHYVLIVRENRQILHNGERIVCERIGVGAIPERFLSTAEVDVEVV